MTRPLNRPAHLTDAQVSAQEAHEAAGSPPPFAGAVWNGLCFIGPAQVTLTEDQVERQVESRTDSADAAFMAGKMTQAEYDARMKEISRWADAAVRS